MGDAAVVVEAVVGKVSPGPVVALGGKGAEDV